MPISFHCETCRRSICVPDGSEGKKTRCSYCASIVQIPFGGSPKLLTGTDIPEVAPLEFDDPLGIVGKNESRWDPPEQAPDPSNPYVSTARNQPLEVLDREANESSDVIAARHQTTLANLAVILMGLGGLFLVFMLVNLFFQITSMVNRPFPTADTIGRMALSTTVVFVQLGTIMALNEARMLRKYWTGCIGMMMAIFPIFNPAACLVFPIGLAIWGLVLILRNDVRTAFESQQK